MLLRLLSSLYLPVLCITVSCDREQPTAPAWADKRSVVQRSRFVPLLVRLSNVALVNRAWWKCKAVHSIFQTEKQPFFDWMRIAMTSQDASDSKICGKFAAITKICQFLRKLQRLLDFAIHSAIAESHNPGGTDKWPQIVLHIFFYQVFWSFIARPVPFPPSSCTFD